MNNDNRYSSHNHHDYDDMDKLKDVSFAFENKPILQDFNLLVQNKDRIGIVGDNGVGKSTLLNLIAERLQLQSAQVIIGETVRVAYF